MPVEAKAFLEKGQAGPWGEGPPTQTGWRHIGAPAGEIDRHYSGGMRDPQTAQFDRKLPKIAPPTNQLMELQLPNAYFNPTPMC